MAKKQTNFLMEDSLKDILQTYADTTGIPFARLMNAAALQFIFGNPCRPDPDWMRHAVAVEKAEISVADVPFKYMEDRIESLERALSPEYLKHFKSAPIIRVQREHELKELRTKLRCLKQALGDDSPLEFLTARTKDRSGVDDYVEVAMVQQEPWAKLAKLESK